MGFRYFFALLMARISVLALKLTGHVGGEYPGLLAQRICPNFIKVAKKAPIVICVTGTNGKTSTANMTADLLRKLGYKVAVNGDGANLDGGVATVLVKGLNIFNKSIVDIQVFEVDERSSRLYIPPLDPDYLIVTNIMRDSCKRNANPDFIFSIFDGFTPDHTKLILNADDIFSSQLKPSSEKAFFGIDKLETDVTKHHNIIADHSYCPKCHSKLQYDYLRFHHIGKAHCPKCGFKSFDADYLVTDINHDDMTMTVSHDGISYTMSIVSTILFYIYNELAVVSFLSEFGVPMEKIAELINATKVPESRLNEISAGNAIVIKTISKGQSAVSTCTTLDFTSKEEGNKVFILCLDDHEDAYESLEFIGWIYDIDYELLAKDDVKQIINLGPNGYDYKLRLLMAGIPEDRIFFTEDEDEAVAAVKTENIDRAYVLFDPGNLAQVDRVTDKVVAKFKAYSMEK